MTSSALFCTRRHDDMQQQAIINLDVHFLWVLNCVINICMLWKLRIISRFIVDYSIVRYGALPSSSANLLFGMGEVVRIRGVGLNTAKDHKGAQRTTREHRAGPQLQTEMIEAHLSTVKYHKDSNGDETSSHHITWRIQKQASKGLCFWEIDLKLLVYNA